MQREETSNNINTLEQQLQPQPQQQHQRGSNRPTCMQCGVLEEESRAQSPAAGELWRHTFKHGGDIPSRGGVCCLLHIYKNRATVFLDCQGFLWHAIPHFWGLFRTKSRYKCLRRTPTLVKLSLETMETLTGTGDLLHISAHISWG